MRRGSAWRCALVVMMLLVLPASARAHAVLERSDPINDVVLTAAPVAITLTFSEKVEPVGSLQLFGDDGAKLAVGEQESVAPNVVRVGVKGPLTRGTHTVVWRALSKDGHAINGAFVFHVQARGANPQGVIGAIGTGEPPRVLRVTSAIARFLNLGFLAIVIGGIALLATILRGCGQGVEQRLWYLVSGAAFAASIAAAATIILQGAEVRGLTIGGAAEGGVISDVVGTQFGRVRLAELLLAELVAVLAVWAAGPARGRGLLTTLGVLALALAATPALSGHAVSVGAHAVVLDTLHMLAASAWAGGLVVLLAGLAFAGGGERGALARRLLPAFSRLAAVCVGVVVLTGAVGALIELGGIGRLWTTAYGALLIAKVALAAALIALGALNRRALAPFVEQAPAAGGRLRRQLGAEVALMVAVLVVATLLVAEPPARSTAAGTGAVSSATRVGDLDVRVVVDPARVGANLVHVYLSRDGVSADADEVRIAASQAEAKLGPISAPTQRNEPGHYVAQALPLAAAGPWRIVATVRTGEFDAVDAVVTVRVRAGSPT